MRIVQMSDVHVGAGLFRQDLLEATIEETNALEPDLVAIVGDLTMEGYRWEFAEAREYSTVWSVRMLYAMGNHDAKNVGYRHFEEFFGIRERSAQIPVPGGEAKVVVLDSTKPDLDEGEVGREHYSWLDSEFRGWDRGPRILMIHHHILAVPGTGRDVNNLRDAGDVMAILRELKVDMVLSGHRHVPYVEHLGGKNSPLGHRIDHARARHDASFLQHYRDRRAERQHYPAPAWQGRGRQGAPRLVLPHARDNERVTPPSSASSSTIVYRS